MSEDAARRGWVPTAKSEIDREQRAHHPCDVACSGFAVATVGKTEELVRGCTDVPACSECAVPRATRACAASPRGGVRRRFPNCLAVKDMYRRTKQKEQPFTLYGSQSKEMGSDRRCLRIRRFLVDVKTSKTGPHTIGTNEQRLVEVRTVDI